MNLTTAMELFFTSMTHNVAPRTITWYHIRLRSLKTHFQTPPQIDNITKADLRAWSASLPQSISAYTRHGYIRAVRRFFTWLHHEDYITDNPAQRLKLPPLPIRQIKGLATTDRNRIIAQAKSKRDFAICLFLSDTACRAAGLCNLKLDDLDLEHCRATVREKGRGGNHKERVIFYTTATAQAITRMLDAKPSSLYVFTKQNGGRLTEQALYKILRRLAKKAGITQGYNPHAWRHGAIRHMLNQGMHLAAASQIAGHSSIKVTGDIYGSQDTNTLQTLHDAYAWTYTTT